MGLVDDGAFWVVECRRWPLPERAAAIFRQRLGRMFGKR